MKNKEYEKVKQWQQSNASPGLVDLPKKRLQENKYDRVEKKEIREKEKGKQLTANV